MKKTRKLKVQGRYRAQKKGHTLVPEIRLVGHWLGELGFAQGIEVEVRPEVGESSSHKISNTALQTSKCLKVSDICDTFATKKQSKAFLRLQLGISNFNDEKINLCYHTYSYPRGLQEKDRTVSQQEC
ncbi:MAG TPA: SymE family type I addiction module toxin [Cytophagales bacterium]|nr:SymE family type I addiction module toxin [Cytophagales bacterium]